jgi:hypothetical protein
MGKGYIKVGLSPLKNQLIHFKFYIGPFIHCFVGNHVSMLIDGKLCCDQGII